MTGDSGDRAQVVVVGAGLAGLAAAAALTRAGAAVHLIERSRLLGGKATSFEVGGVEVDNGQHVVLKCCTEFLDFATQLGMRNSLRFQPRFNATVLTRDGPPARLRAAPLPAPLHLALGFASYRHVNAGDKLRVLSALLAARKPVDSKLDMATWLQRHRQNARTRRAFWDPFLIPALNTSLEKASAQDGLFVIRTAFLGRRDAACIGYSTVPLARMAEKAAALCETVTMRSPVTSLVVRDGAVAGVRLDSGTTIPCDACVLAVPPRRVAAILAESNLPVIDGLDAFQTEPIVDVHLWYDRPLNMLDFAAILDSPVQWAFRKGKGYVACSLSAAGALVSRPQSELVAMADQELRAVIPALRGARLVHSACTRDPEATFVPTPGLRRPNERTSLPTLMVAGAWTDTGWPATMESAVRSGRAAARALIPTLRAQRARALRGRAGGEARVVEMLRAV